MRLPNVKKILVIQTAFIGDVVLATSVVEKLHQFYPEANLDFLLRKGNEKLFDAHPFINQILIWDKKNSKTRNWLKLIFEVRKKRYDLLVNLQRFLSTGLIMGFSGAKVKICYSENPISFMANHSEKYAIGIKGQNVHEIERSTRLISQITDNQTIRPRLYPSKQDFEKQKDTSNYITISPASVWATKQFPKEKWLAFMDRVGEGTPVYLLGGSGDKQLCGWLASKTVHRDTVSKAGQLSFLESAALMAGAKMNFVNDSAPLHFASALNAPVTAVFCSTVPQFGFGPLSENSALLETSEHLACRPCGLHGRKNCPEGHFRCSEIPIEKLLARIQ